MKDLVLRLVQAFMRLFRRFQAGEPAGPFEGIAFGALRSAVAVAFFPPGVNPGAVANAAQ